jgi:putative hydrolase of the HAD superfamily
MSSIGDSHEGTIRAVVFDLDGVIREWDVRETHAIERHYGLAHNRIRTAAFSPERNARVILGEVSDENWRKETSDILEAEYGEAGREAALEWSRRIGSVNVGVEHFVKTIRQNFTVVLLTNATSRLLSDLSQLKLDKAFDAIFNSSEMGMAKPNSKVYEFVSKSLDLELSEWLFVDDTKENTSAAEDIGVDSHHFTGLPDLQMWLRSRGVE